MRWRSLPFRSLLLLGLLVGLALGVPWHLASHGHDEGCPFEMLLGAGGPLPDAPASSPSRIEQPAPPVPTVAAPCAPYLDRARSRAPPTAWI